MHVVLCFMVYCVLNNKWVEGGHVWFLVTGCMRLYFSYKTGRFGLNIGLKSYFVVTQFPQKWRSKGIENLSNLDYMSARLFLLFQIQFCWKNRSVISKFYNWNSISGHGIFRIPIADSPGYPTPYGNLFAICSELRYINCCLSHLCLSCIS